MNYRLIGDGDLFNIEETILKNRGIKNTNEFLNVGIEHTHDYRLLDNIQLATDTILETLDCGGTIYLPPDQDCDGVTSASIFYNRVKRSYPNANIIWEMKLGKVHGITSKEVPEGVDLVVVIDGGTNDIVEHRKLAERGIKVVIIDHHEVNDDIDIADINKNAILVNNQTSEKYPNKQLCGAGVAYKVCQCIDDKLEEDYADDYLDLVALGLVADMMDMRELETRYYTLKGLSNIRNEFLKALIDKQSYSMKGVVNTTSVSWYVSPLINGTIRVGKLEEKNNMFKAFLEDRQHETIPYKKRGTTEEIQQPLTEAMARICGNVKGRQDRAKKKGATILEERIVDKNLDDNKILIINCTDELEGAFTGLVANQLRQEYDKPVLMLREMEEKGENGATLFNGSGRGMDKGMRDCDDRIVNFKDYLTSTGMFELVSGHQGAFGVVIDKDNIVPLNKLINKELEDIDYNFGTLVDFIIDAKNIDASLIHGVDALSDVWGRGIAKPCIAYENIIINKSDIKTLGAKEDTVKFTYGGVEFIKFRSPDFKDKIDRGSLRINVMGTCSVNEYGGVRKPQIIIDDISVKKNVVEENSFDLI